MRRAMLLSVLTVVLAFLLPLLLFAAPARRAEKPDAPAEETEPEAGAAEIRTPARPVVDAAEVLSVRTEDGDVEMTMADYLPLAVAGEMPAAFEPEALKAQAVALRSYVLHYRAQRKDAHPEADICTDPGCCAAYLSENALRAAWGEKFEAYYAKILAAAAETDGQYLAYDGAPILAVFHASSYRSTEDGAGLGVAAPYLSAVATPETGEAVKNLHSTVEVGRADFKQTVQSVFPGVVLDEGDDPAAWVGEVRLSAAGRVAEAEIGGVAVSGLALRNLFSLRSTDFMLAWDADADAFVFRVSGYGHGLGMSQYGADLMAKEGTDYAGILEHYYPGTMLVRNSETEPAFNAGSVP